MNEIEEIKKELASLQEKVAKMGQAKDEPTERWKPSKGVDYKFIVSTAIIGEYEFTGHSIDEAHIRFGNAFPKDMPLDDVVMLHQFINEMGLICWQLGATSSQDTVAYVIQSKCGIICYRFGSIIQRDLAYSMLSDKIKGLVEM